MRQSTEARKQSDRAYRLRNAEVIRAKQPERIERWQKRNLLNALIVKSRSAAKQRGLVHTITVDDVVWSTHCPVLGIELCYDWDEKKKQSNRSNFPSLDRWDNSVGYVPGNVFVISHLANATKSRLSVKDMEAVVRYMKTKPSVIGVPVVDPKTLYPDMPYLHKNTAEAVKAKVEELGWECIAIPLPGPQGGIRGRVTIHCSKHKYTSAPLVEKLMYMRQGCRHCGFDRLRAPASGLILS